MEASSEMTNKLRDEAERISREVVKKSRHKSVSAVGDEYEPIKILIQNLHQNITEALLAFKGKDERQCLCSHQKELDELTEARKTISALKAGLEGVIDFAWGYCQDFETRLKHPINEKEIKANWDAYNQAKSLLTLPVKEKTHKEFGYDSDGEIICRTVKDKPRQEEKKCECYPEGDGKIIAHSAICRCSCHESSQEAKEIEELKEQLAVQAKEIERLKEIIR